VPFRHVLITLFNKAKFSSFVISTKAAIRAKRMFEYFLDYFCVEKTTRVKPGHRNKKLSSLKTFMISRAVSIFYFYCECLESISVSLHFLFITFSFDFCWCWYRNDSLILFQEPTEEEFVNIKKSFMSAFDRSKDGKLSMNEVYDLKEFTCFW